MVRVGPAGFFLISPKLMERSEHKFVGRINPAKLKVLCSVNERDIERNLVGHCRPQLAKAGWLRAFLFLDRKGLLKNW
jgi:hypothetical protein